MYKNVPFNFKGEIYVQIYGVVTGSPIGLVLKIFFMVELKNTIIPWMENKIKVRYATQFAL